MRAPATALPTPIPAAAPGEIEWFFVGFVVGFVVPDGVVVELVVPDGIVMELDVLLVVGTGEVIGDESEMETILVDEVDSLEEPVAFVIEFEMTGEDVFGIVIGKTDVCVSVTPVKPGPFVREYKDAVSHVAVERIVSTEVSFGVS